MIDATNQMGYRAPMVRKSELAAETWDVFHSLMGTFRDSFLGIARELDLGPGELKALEALDPDHAQPMGALAQTLRCDASNVTWLADRLEARGFVERRAAASDRRVKTLALTPAGRAARARVEEHLHTPPAALLALSTTELRTLRDLLERCGGEHRRVQAG